MKLRIALAATLITIIPAVASSQPSEPARFRRWGIGWDSGVAARYFVKPNWGVGVRVYPSVDNDDTKTSTSDLDARNQPDVDLDSSRAKERVETVNWTFGAIGFMDFKVTGRFRAGPFVRLAYGYSSGTYEETTTTNDMIDPDAVRSTRHLRSTNVTNSWSAGVGVRPSLVIRDRILLEARFGLDLSLTDREYERTEEFTPDEREPLEATTYHRKETTDTWELHAAGHDQPVYATLQMILLF